MSAKDRGADKSRRSAESHSSAVGYGRPPVAKQFKPGTSGNPKGRPTGAKNLKTLIREAMTGRRGAASNAERAQGPR